MANPSVLRSGWLTPGLAGCSTVCALLAGAGVSTPAMASLAALAAGATVVSALQAWQDRRHLLEQLDGLKQQNRQSQLLLQEENQRLQRELERLDQLKAELVAAKQTAEAAVLAKGEFLATMSHEIRTPLNGIVPMLDLMARGPLDPAQQHMLLTATASSQQLLRIVDDILDYSKLEANKLELESTALNLHALMQELVSLLGSSAARKKVETRLEIDPGVRLSVRGDPVRLRQVLGNLISNAIKFTDRGHITLRVSSPGETASQHVVRFEVIDTGIGIEPEKQQNLFQPFSQADASTTRLYGGTGLGLAICRRIVDLMEGRIGVHSTPGQGSTFWFEVPLLKAVGDMPFQISTPEPVPGLLVSADPTLTERLQRLANRWGVKLHHVSNAHDALDHLRLVDPRHRPELVIADADSLRQTLQALHRAVVNCNPVPRLVWLTGTTALAPSLTEHAYTVNRQSGDGELRHAIAPLVAFPAPPPVLAPPAPVVHAPCSEADAWVDEGQDIIAGMRVLLVEDNPVNRLVAQHLLDSLGVTVTLAENGQQAMALLPRSHVDAVLMDCQMPVLDGYQATRQWRSLERAENRPRLPIIAMTANAMGGDRQRCLDAGMDDYLSKPVERSELLRLLVHWRQQAGTLATAADSSATAPEDAPEAPDRSPSRNEAAASGAADGGADNLTSPTEATPAPAQAHSHAMASPHAPAAPLSHPPSGQPPLDAAVLDELHQLIGAHTHDIVSAYLSDTPLLLEQMQQAADTGDLHALGEAAHSLKSASANVGANGLAGIALRIETGARDHQLDNPAANVALLVAEFARIRIGLRAWQSRTRNTETPASTG